MTAGRPLRILVAIFALWAAAATADAQITTGTITGNIKDAQSGVIPGATVTLVSATRATTLATAVTNADGDYVFPNVPPDTYIVRVTMDGFKTIERSGISVSPGDRVALADADHRSRRPRGDRHRRRRVPADSVAHRRALLHRRDRLGPEPAHQQPQLHQPHLARPRRRRRAATIPAASAAAGRTTR